MTGTRRPLALVTGATAGIGAEFARALAAAGNDLVLVARDAARLETSAAALRAAHGVRVDVIAADLTTPAGIDVVQRRVAESVHPVDILVNNAGFGLRGDFEKTALDDELALLDLLVTVPMRLSHAALAQMLPRRSGTIVNVASVAGFTPRGSYGAAKAWVLSFSRWANLHYRPSGITVTAVAPGFVRTEFHERMAVQTTAVPRFMWLDASTLVRLALRDVARGRAVSIPTLRYKLLVAAVAVLPDRWTAMGELKPR